MIITIHQPEHLPWLGYFNKMAKAEEYVFLDSVPFRKNYVQNRNRIVGTNGVTWIGVPVRMENHSTGSIRDTRIAGEAQPAWKQKYLRTIGQSYGKHRYFDEVYPIVEEIISGCGNSLCTLNMAIIQAFAGRLGIQPRFVRSSDMEVSGSKSGLILAICKASGADLYIAGPSGRKYLEMDSFRDAGIDVKFNDYDHPVYPQRKSAEFIPHLSALDLFMNCGFGKSPDVIMDGNTGLSDA